MEIKAFKAFRFNPAVVGDAGRCIAPPYDVINPQQQQKLYEKSEYNIARIIKGKTESSDNEQNNQYTRAADYLNGWIKAGVLKADSADSIYGYVQNFELSPNSFQRISFIALGKLEEFGKTIKAHEQTMQGPRTDRLNLKRATAADFGLIFMLYEDEQNTTEKIVENIMAQEALLEFTDEQNVQHRLFRITEPKDIDTITEMMSSKSCIIADGHHRYETGLAYSKESKNPDANYLMLGFTNVLHEGMTVLATHRLVSNLADFSVEKLIAGLQEDFEITKYTSEDAKEKTLSRMKAEMEKDKNAFGIYAANNAFYTAVLKNSDAMDSVAPNMSCAWKSLDVAVLSKLILEKSLGIGEKEVAQGNNVEYIKDSGNQIDELITKIDVGEKQVVFLMNPPKIKQIQAVASAGEKMPQKSTYFYPKLYSGLTINKL